MPCERCGQVPSSTQPHSAILSAPEAFVRINLIKALSSAGLAADASPLGIETPLPEPCHLDKLLTALATLSTPERRDIRIALVQAPGDDAAKAKALFTSKTAEELIYRQANRWLPELLSADRLTSYFHPLVLNGSEIFAHECLVRGVAEDGSLISPGKLFDTARQLDLLFQLDQRARLGAVRAAAGANPPPNARFFVNFLPTAIYDPAHCLRSTMAAINTAGFVPSQFCFEVVESEHVTDRDHLRKILKYYRERGFQVALDDMGEGNSSIMSLVDLKPDYVKLDGELVRRAVTNRLEGALVREIAQVAPSEGITVIAEGIETQEQLDWIHNVGITITQGFIWSKPAPTLLPHVSCLPQTRVAA